MDNNNSGWTPRHEFASRAMQEFIRNAGRDPEQPGLSLPLVAASSVAWADAMLSAMETAPLPVVPGLAELAKASGTEEILSNYEAARGDQRFWQQRALDAEAKLRAIGETIVARPHDRRAH